MEIILRQLEILLTYGWYFTVDFEEVKTAATECKEKCFQMSHLPIFAIVKHLNVDYSSKKELR